jgi:hypothetical protein
MRRESMETISPFNRAANFKESAVLPTAVGPTIAMIEGLVLKHTLLDLPQ